MRRLAIAVADMKASKVIALTVTSLAWIWMNSRSHDPIFIFGTASRTSSEAEFGWPFPSSKVSFERKCKLGTSWQKKWDQVGLLLNSLTLSATLLLMSSLSFEKEQWPRFTTLDLFFVALLTGGAVACLLRCPAQKFFSGELTRLSWRGAWGGAVLLACSIALSFAVSFSRRDSLA